MNALTEPCVLSFPNILETTNVRVLSMPVGLLPPWLPRTEGASPLLSLLIPLHLKAGVGGDGAILKFCDRLPPSPPPSKKPLFTLCGSPALFVNFSYSSSLPIGKGGDADKVYILSASHAIPLLLLLPPLPLSRSPSPTSWQCFPSYIRFTNS